MCMLSESSFSSSAHKKHMAVLNLREPLYKQLLHVVWTRAFGHIFNALKHTSEWFFPNW